MLQSVIRRLLSSAATVVIIVTICFFLLHLAPGDVADVIGADAGGVTEEMLAALRARYGLDKPLIVQYFIYVSGLLTFDFGFSFRSNIPNAELIRAAILPSVVLMLTSIIVAVLVGTMLGMLSAYQRGELTDMLISTISMFFVAVPLFWLGLMMIVLFSVRLGWLPTGGMNNFRANATGFGYALDVARHLILPAGALALHHVGVYAKLARAAVLEVKELDFVRNAQAKGLRPRTVAYRYVLPNALLPLVTLTGLQLGTLLGGSIVIETIFSWPGLGRLAYEAVLGRDLNLALSVMFLSSIVVVTANLLTDVAYKIIDPRI